MSVLGLDIGGANLKAAHLNGTARIQSFELWKRPHELAGALAELLRQMPPFDTLAVTMTGELCDCFETKRQGVEALLDAACAAAPGKKILVWHTDGRFTDSPAARRTPLQTAAANWLALAVYAGRFVPHGPALLVDVGSTTTDVVPIENGVPVPQGRTDTERLRCQELVYTGVKRTPICALLGSAVAAEVFATTWDVYLLLEELPESADCGTADGRPAARLFAHARLARMLGGDGETCPPAVTAQLARQAALVQQSIVQNAIRRVQRSLSGKPVRVLVSGSGEFLARKALRREGVDEESILCLSNHLGPLVSESACAHALAILAQEQGGNAP